MNAHIPSPVSPEVGGAVVRKHEAVIDVSHISHDELALLSTISQIRAEAEVDESIRAVSGIVLNSFGRLTADLTEEQQAVQVRLTRDDIDRYVNMFVPGVTEQERYDIMERIADRLADVQQVRVDQQAAAHIEELRESNQQLEAENAALTAQLSTIQRDHAMLGALMRLKYKDDPALLDDLDVFFGKADSERVPESTISGPIPAPTAQEVYELTKPDTTEADSPGYGYRLGELFKAAVRHLTTPAVPSEEALQAERLLEEARAKVHTVIFPH